MFFDPTEKSRKIYKEPGIFYRLFSLESFLKAVIFGLLLIIFNIGIEAVTQKQRFVANSSGITLSKEYKEPYTTTTLMSTGKSLIPITQSHPAQFILLVKEKNRTCSISVSEELFKGKEKGYEISLKIYQKSYWNILFQKTTTEQCVIP